METNTTVINIFELPVYVVLTDRELELAIECWQRRYGEAAAQAAAAYDMYDAAIDTNEPYKLREQMWQTYLAVDAVRLDTYRKLDGAKGALLEREARRS